MPTGSQRRRQRRSRKADALGLDLEERRWLLHHDRRPVSTQRLMQVLLNALVAGDLTGREVEEVWHEAHGNDPI